MKKCEAYFGDEPCPHKHYSKGLCSVHYQRKQLGSDLNAPRSNAGRPKGRKNNIPSEPKTPAPQDHPLRWMYEDRIFVGNEHPLEEIV